VIPLGCVRAADRRADHFEHDLTSSRNTRSGP
jgi:hypothetical protein